MKNIVCLMGPTASGKSSLAIQLVEQFNFEIISVDSAMIYKGLDIGTAKPLPDILKKIPHALIDIAHPHEIYSAGQFRQDALLAIESMIARGKTPLLVGGTMLYFRILLSGLSPMPKADANVRQFLQQKAQQQGWQFLHAELKKVDPEASSRIAASDKQRIQRALEVYMLSGKTITAWQKETTHSLTNYHVYLLALIPAREILQQRIRARFQQMLELGFLNEALQLFNHPQFSYDLPAMRTVGYASAWDFFAGKTTYEEMCEKAVIATRQLAKRQMTWLRSYPRFDCSYSDSQEFLQDKKFFSRITEQSSSQV